MAQSESSWSCALRIGTLFYSTRHDAVRFQLEKKKKKRTLDPNLLAVEDECWMDHVSPFRIPDWRACTQQTLFSHRFRGWEAQELGARRLSI